MKYQPDWRDLSDYVSYGIGGEEPPISLGEFARLSMSPDLLVASSRLFFPEFVVHKNGVFLAERFSVSLFESWNRGRYRNDIGAIERVINHVHLAESWQFGFLKLNKQNRYYLGEVLIQTWKAALTYEFPERSFEVLGTQDEVGRSPDSGDYEIAFLQPNLTGEGKSFCALG
jgi:hypothetical protein